MKKIFLLLATLIVIGAGCSSQSAITTSSSSSQTAIPLVADNASYPNTFKVYASKEISFHYPADWATSIETSTANGFQGWTLTRFKDKSSRVVMILQEPFWESQGAMGIDQSMTAKEYQTNDPMTRLFYSFYRPCSNENQMVTSTSNPMEPQGPSGIPCQPSDHGGHIFIEWERGVTTTYDGIKPVFHNGARTPAIEIYLDNLDNGQLGTDYTYLSSSSSEKELFQITDSILKSFTFNSSK